MAEEVSVSLVHMGKLSKPADTLVKKISSAVGGLCRPWQVKRVAKAETEAALLKAQTQIEITELHNRALHRFVEEEAQRQQNMESIAEQALTQLNDDADPDGMEDDWVTNFFDKCRIVSDAQMQALWAQVLKGEANAPGSYSKRTVNFLAELDKSDAELFTSLCGFGWTAGELVPLVFDVQAEIYTNAGLNYDTLSHLESIGLVQFNSIATVSKLRLPKWVTLDYFGTLLTLELPKDADNSLDIGKVRLTKTGHELASLCGSTPVDGFLKYVKQHWKDYLPSQKADFPKGPEH